MENQTNPKLPQRKIGSDSVPAIGLGLAGMSFGYKFNEDPVEAEKKHLEVLTRAADAGETFWDTSDFYGTNEELIGKWFKLTGRRKEIFLATKFGVLIDPNTKKGAIRGDRDYVRQCIEGSLKRLGTDYVDLYCQHRVDKNTRIEDTVAALAELVKEGKVRYIGLSECSANTIRRAHAVHPISVVQMEYTLISREIEDQEVKVKQTCDELGIAIVSYSPLGRGLLTGKITRDNLLEGDMRFVIPRFSEENIGHNKAVVDKIAQIAEKKGCTSAQLALAWLLKQGDNVIPIPGTRQLKHLEENLGALKVNLNDDEVNELRTLVKPEDVKGTRYYPSIEATIFAETI